MTFARIARIIPLTIVFAAIAAAAAAEIIRVPEDQPTLGAACEVAQVGDEIVAQPGVYHESDLGQDYGISIRSAVEGQYVIIDAAGGSSFGLRIHPIGAPVELRWLEIRNATHRGLGLSVPPGRTAHDVVVEHCRMVGNQGGGLAISGGIEQDRRFVIRDTEITDNRSDRFGGGLWASWDNAFMAILLERVVFRGNSSGDLGGGVCAFRSLTAVDCVWDGNVAEGGGGGLYAQFESDGVVIENGVFSKNVATKYGGGFHADSNSRIELHDTRFVGNSAPTGPAGFVSAFAYALLHCCEFHEGAVGVADEDATLVIDDSDCSVTVEATTLSDLKALLR